MQKTELLFHEKLKTTKGHEVPHEGTQRKKILGTLKLVQASALKLVQASALKLVQASALKLVQASAWTNN